MEKFFYLIVILFFSSCMENEKSLQYEVTESYQVKRSKDTIFIEYNSCRSGKSYAQKYKLIKKNGEFYDHNGELFLSTSRVYDKVDTNSNNIPDINHMKIFKFSHDVFVTSFSTPVNCVNGKEHLLIAYYYNKNYDILKITKPSRIVYK